jgi:hypothetical protein
MLDGACLASTHRQPVQRRFQDLGYGLRLAKAHHPVSGLQAGNSLLAPGPAACRHLLGKAHLGDAALRSDGAEVHREPLFGEFRRLIARCNPPAVAGGRQGRVSGPGALRHDHSLT